jgi:hypothetical protein
MSPSTSRRLELFPFTLTKVPMSHDVFDSQSSVQRIVQRGLTDEDREALESPPNSHRLTLDGHCALAGPGRAVIYDLDGRGFVYQDLADLDPLGWVS